MPSAPSFPHVHPRPGLPEEVTIYEVGPRDGLQAEIVLVPTEDKLEYIRALVSAGLPLVEATSFVSPKRVPQLADATEVLAALEAPLRHPVLVPNLKGLARAVDAGAEHIAVFISATETFAQRNLGMTRRQALDTAAAVTEKAVSLGLTVRGYVSMCFGDPWEGTVEGPCVTECTTALIDSGCSEVSLGDTIGTATPGHVLDLIEHHRRSGIPTASLALHFHDTYGQALANVLAGLEAGITCFDSSAGGIGGCPFARSATGNLATEDLVWMLDGLAITTGVSLDAVVQAGRMISRVLNRPVNSRVGQAWASREKVGS